MFTRAGVFIRAGVLCLLEQVVFIRAGGIY